MGLDPPVGLGGGPRGRGGGASIGARVVFLLLKQGGDLKVRLQLRGLQGIYRRPVIEPRENNTGSGICRWRLNFINK